MKEQLIKFFEERHTSMDKISSFQDRWAVFAQAFGALEFARRIHPELDAELITLWEEYYEKFWHKMRELG